MPTYALPSDKELTAVLPATVIQDTTATATTKQTVCSPAYKSVMSWTNNDSSSRRFFDSVHLVVYLNLKLNQVLHPLLLVHLANDFTCIEVDDELGSNPTLASSGIT